MNPSNVRKPSKIRLLHSRILRSRRVHLYATINKMLSQKISWKNLLLPAALTFFFSFLVVGCGKTEKPAAESKWRIGKPPIEKQFKNVESIESVFWKGGICGGVPSRLEVPGPSEYYLKGFMVVSEEEAKKWKDAYAWGPPRADQKLPEDFPSAISKEIPFQWSEKFEKELWPRDYQGLILFSPEDRVLYFDLMDCGMVSPGK